MVLRAAWLCIFALLLASCVDSYEEIWIGADGGGRAELAYEFPESALRFSGGVAGLRERVAEALARAPELIDPTCTVASRGGRVRVGIALAFKDARDLSKLADAGKGTSTAVGSEIAARIAGKFTTSLHGRRLDVFREVKWAEVIPGAAFSDPAQWKNHTLRTVIHLPVAAVETNATRRTDAGKTLIWETPLAVALERPMVNRFSIHPPIPVKWKITAVAAGGLLLAGTVLYFLRRKSRTRSA